MDDAQFNRRMQRIEELITAIQDHGNPVVRASAVEMVRALLDVHRAGLIQVLEQIANQGQPGQAILNRLVNDDLVSRLLLLHGLHPVDLTARVTQALEGVRPLLHQHAADVELKQASHEAVRLQMQGDSEAIQQLLEKAILEAAPDVLRIEFLNGDAVAKTLTPLPLVPER
jgi:Fe-S cluster biogenesis protein NfuA